MVKEIGTTVAWVVVGTQFRDDRKERGKPYGDWDYSIFWKGDGLYRCVQFLNSLNCTFIICASYCVQIILQVLKSKLAYVLDIIDLMKISPSNRMLLWLRIFELLF